MHSQKTYGLTTIWRVQITGDITYNGKHFDEFIAQRTSAYIEETDLHLPELTVRETMNFAARVQGTGYKAREHSILLTVNEACFFSWYFYIFIPLLPNCVQSFK